MIQVRPSFGLTWAATIQSRLRNRPPPLGRRPSPTLVTFVSPSRRFLWRFHRHHDTPQLGDGIRVPPRPHPPCGPYSVFENPQSRRTRGQPAEVASDHKSEHPAKIMPSNSHGQTWIRITRIFINDMRTIYAQTIDSKPPRWKIYVFRCYSQLHHYGSAGTSAIGGVRTKIPTQGQKRP